MKSFLFALLFASLAAAAVIEYDSLPIYVGGGTAAAEPTGQCVGASPGLPPSLSACKSVYADVKAEAARQGYASACNDPGLLLLFSKLYQESSCNPSLNSQGLFQIPACQKKGCTYRENVERGIRESISNCLAVKKSLPFADTTTIAEATLFAYNRGEGTLARAISIYETGGDWKQSMVSACLTEFDAGSYGNCGGFDRNACCGLQGTHDGEPHSGNGLGSRYGEKILGLFKLACRQAGGRIG